MYASGSFSSESFGGLPTTESLAVAPLPGTALFSQTELDCASELDSPSSLTPSRGLVSSGAEAVMQRSASSSNGFYAQFASFSDMSPVRRTFSAGELHRGESPLWSESNAIIERMNRANPYSPEEKKERIERYRNKRNLRNFNKRIKYECRKTLADSRPRIRGRFAKNDETETETETEIEKNSPMIHWNQDQDLDDEAWIQLIDSYSASQFL